MLFISLKTYVLNINMNESIKFSIRLKNAMEKAGYKAKPTVLEREFNTRFWGKSVTLQGARRWLVGESIPTQEKLLILSKWLGVDPNYLRFGEIRNELIIKNESDIFIQSLSDSELKTLKKFNTLTENQRKLIFELLNIFIN